MSYVEEMFGLKGKVVVVTGGAGAIAGAIIESYLKAGAKVAIWDFRPEGVKEAMERYASVSKEKNATFGFTLDTTDAAKVLEAYEATKQSLGTPNVLVNGVGGNRGKSAFIDADPKAFEDILRLNLVAGFLVPTQVFAREWIKGGIKGSVINFASMGSYIPLSGVWAYDAAKAAVLNLTAACAKEFGSVGIRVNALAPGFFLGKQNFDLLIANVETMELTQRGKDVISRTPTGRFGKVEELTGAAVFLASDAASGFVTGITLPIDGGFLTDNI